MKNLTLTSRSFIYRAATAAIFAMVTMGAWAQDTTTATYRHGEKSYTTEVRNADVVYVAGHDLVLKQQDGKIEHLVVPDSDRFRIDGRNVSVHELTRGMKLTQTITTTTVPRYVTTIRTVKGKVFHVTPPSTIIVSLPDNSNQVLKVPADTKFKVNGREITAFELRNGMKIEATIVTDSSETVMSQSKKVTGIAPPPVVLPELGVLLIQFPAATPAVVAVQPVDVASAEPIAATLPKTGTLLPLAGLMGLLSIGGSLGLRLARGKATS
jgi:hypothetical protein